MTLVQSLKARERAIDLSGTSAGMLSYIEEVGYERNQRNIKVRCACGTEKVVQAKAYISNQIKSCGCLMKEFAKQRAPSLGRAARIDFTGHRFGRWTALTPVARKRPSGARVTYWICRCDCGVEREVDMTILRKGESKSCGCYNKDISTGRASTRKIDITGKRYGKLTAVKPTEKRINGRVVWSCLCDCGGTKEVTISNLGSRTNSCGCMK